MNEEALKFPTGRFSPLETYSRQDIDQCIARIAALPSRVEALVKNFSPADYERTYRPGGWTARQVLHHLPDSHLNAYVRFKWTLTEDTPVIKAYNEKRWAETPEVQADPLISVNLLKALHAKWVLLMEGLSEEDLGREYVHPETNKHNRLDRIIAMYAWHGDHHLGHLKIVADQSH
jgi:hypothetical protein